MNETPAYLHRSRDAAHQRPVAAAAARAVCGGVVPGGVVPHCGPATPLLHEVPKPHPPPPPVLTNAML